MAICVHGATHDHAVTTRRLTPVTCEEAAGVARLTGVWRGAGIVKRVAQRFRRRIDTGLRGTGRTDHMGRDYECSGDLQRATQNNSAGKIFHGLDLLQ
jgi:hypothetical protein